jgi:histidyl-tRNA synthetase
VLTGKYGEEGDQLIFKILRRGEHEASGEADLALRYDLTVPLARVAARYGSQLPTPFKRYHIAPGVAGRPARQGPLPRVLPVRRRHGRLRLAGRRRRDDRRGRRRARRARPDGFRVQLNSRKALRGLVEAYGIPASARGRRAGGARQARQDRRRRGRAELRERGIPAARSTRWRRTSAADDLRRRSASGCATERGRAGLAEVDRVLELVGDVPGRVATYAPVLARGLSYYTGPVFEVVHDGLDATIAAGGRYDGLIGMFQARRPGDRGLARARAHPAAARGSRGGRADRAGPTCWSP